MLECYVTVALGRAGDCNDWCERCSNFEGFNVRWDDEVSSLELGRVAVEWVALCSSGDVWVTYGGGIEWSCGKRGGSVELDQHGEVCSVWEEVPDWRMNGFG